MGINDTPISCTCKYAPKLGMGEWDFSQPAMKKISPVLTDIGKFSPCNKKHYYFPVICLTHWSRRQLMCVCLSRISTRRTGIMHLLWNTSKIYFRKKESPVFLRYYIYNIWVQTYDTVQMTYFEPKFMSFTGISDKA